MNNKIPIIITIITLFIITFFTFSNTGQFIGIVLANSDSDNDNDGILDIDECPAFTGVIKQ